IGLIWDNENYSCAYVAFLSILLDIWLYNPQKWTSNFNGCNKYLNAVAQGFKEITGKKKTIENVRDDLRNQLNMDFGSENFPYGPVGTSLGLLLSKCMSDDIVPTSRHVICNQC
ncbi:hypothetical protein BT96DRAFT_751835, partial [Gymnopus androsaceus JB14]